MDIIYSQIEQLSEILEILMVEYNLIEAKGIYNMVEKVKNELHKSDSPNLLEQFLSIKKNIIALKLKNRAENNMLTNFQIALQRLNIAIDNIINNQ